MSRHYDVGIVCELLYQGTYSNMKNPDVVVRRTSTSNEDARRAYNVAWPVISIVYVIAAVIYAITESKGAFLSFRNGEKKVSNMKFEAFLF